MHQCLSWEILHFILGKSFDFFIVFIFQTFFYHAARLVGSQFPNQGLNPRSQQLKAVKALSPNHQRARVCVCVCVCVCVSVCVSIRTLSRFHLVQLFVTLWTIARQTPLSMGFSRQEYWSGLPCPSLEDLPNPGIEPTSLKSPALAGGLFTTSATWEAPNHQIAWEFPDFFLVERSLPEWT